MRTSLFLVLTGVCLLLSGTVSATIHYIGMEDFVFDPPNVTIIPGDTVRWVLVSGTHATISDPESPKQWGTLSLPRRHRHYGGYRLYPGRMRGFR